MKKQILKLTMLLLAIVFGGSSALAEQKVICNYPSSGSWTDAEVAEWSNVFTNDRGIAGTNDVSKWSATPFKKGESFSISKSFKFISNSKVILSANVKLGNDCGNETSYEYFSFGGLNFKVFRVKNGASAYKLAVDGGEDKELSLVTYTNAVYYTINFVIDQATNKASYTISYNDKNNEKQEVTGTTTTTTALEKVAFGHYFTNSKTATVVLRSLKITEEPAASTSSIDLTLNNSYTYSTFCSTESDVDFTNVKDVEAYQASVNNNVVSLTKVTGKVKAGEGLLIKNVGKVESVSIPTTTGATALEGNKLVGVTKPLTATDFADKTAYILASDTEFQLITSATTGTFAVGKAYLDCTAEAGAKPSSLFFGEATGINGVAVEKKADNVIYNLQGMCVKTPTKGLYIVNGKKYRF